MILQAPPAARPDRLAEAGELPTYVAVLREVAAERQIALIDHWTLFQKHLASAESQPDWWAADGHLPNVRGHFELARQLFEALNAH